VSRFRSVADDAMEREEGKAAGRKGEQRLVLCLVLFCWRLAEILHTCLVRG